MTEYIEPDWEMHERVLASIPGGAELIAWFGKAPTFHDAEIETIEVGRRGGLLTVQYWRDIEEVYSGKATYVTFAFEKLVDLELDGFYDQNVLFELVLKSPAARPERVPYHGPESTSDIEIDLQSTIGTGGFLRCRGLAVSFMTKKAKGARKARLKTPALVPNLSTAHVIVTAAGGSGLEI